MECWLYKGALMVDVANKGRIKPVSINMLSSILDLKLDYTFATLLSRI